MDSTKVKQTAPLPGEEARKLFPIFSGAGSARMAYLDSAATSQKPSPVIERLSHYLAHEHANVHRGAYGLSAVASALYEGARAKVANFIGAGQAKNVIFTSGTTESINLAAYALTDYFNPGDTVLLTLLEHHSNIVPWQLLAKRRGVRLAFCNISPNGEIDLNDLRAKAVSLHPKLISVAHISNVFGSVTALDEVVNYARGAGALVLVDAAQSVAHRTLDVEKLEVDLLAFSGHKLYGPTGIGVLYANERVLELMQPFQGGGGMIEEVQLEKSSWAPAPHKFEAGTPPIAEAVGLGAAVEFVSSVGFAAIAQHDKKLLQLLLSILQAEPAVNIYGPATQGSEQSSIVSFTVDGVHPHDFATVADSLGVQLRAGHHCAMPAMNRLGLSATVRASLGMYSTTADIEALKEVLLYAKKLFGVTAR